MSEKPKRPSEPASVHETVRRQLSVALIQGNRSAKELSSEIRIPEKEIYDHLEHIRRSLLHSGQRLAVTPAECRKCGFVFSKRGRLAKPGKCPRCRAESIRDPRFSIEE